VRRGTRISVLIPTRERADTLVSSLRTCTSQDDDDLEIIVSDNFSSDGTREVVDSFHDGRIRYVNTEKRLGMSQNWEFALAHAEGDYVTFLGDDDGLLPGAIGDLRALVADDGYEAVSWRSGGYCWPDHPAESARNILTVPFGDSVSEFVSASVLNEVLGCKRRYEELPWLYKGLAARSAVDRVIAEAGRFFCSQNPDIYSGVALACVVDAYLYSSRPYSLNGASRHSTGTSGMTDIRGGAPTQKFESEENIPFHADLDVAPSIPILVAESLLQARDNMDSAKRFQVDLQVALETSLRQAVTQSPQQHHDVVAAVLATARRNGMEVSRFERLASDLKNNPPAAGGQRLQTFEIGRDQVTVDCTRFQVKNVCDAAQLCKIMLLLHDEGVFLDRSTFAAAAARVASYVRRRFL